jgi:hypothetical protein
MNERKKEIPGQRVDKEGNKRKEKQRQENTKRFIRSLTVIWKLLADFK